MKNNNEIFYEKSSQLIDLLYEPICSLNDNYEYEKKKILSKMGNISQKEFFKDILTWQFLIDYSFLGLNREKIENAVNVNWEKYIPQTYVKQFSFKDLRPSKALYFKEWLKVIDCKEKYKTETPNFWIKRIRDSFMHGNFEFDYDDIKRQRIKLVEGSESSVDVRADISILGLHEFIEDNFHNVYHQDYGIVDEYINVYTPKNLQINNRAELENVLKNQIYICFRKSNSVYNYDGNKLVEISTGKTISRKEAQQNVMDLNTEQICDFEKKLDGNLKIAIINKDFVDVLIWILENKYNIYNTSKKSSKILNAISQYMLPMKGINKLLREFNNYFGGIALDKKEYNSAGIDIKKMFAVFNEEKENVDNAFVVLRLYKFLYRLQNKGFEKIDLNNFDCEKSFMVSNEEEMQKRIEKNEKMMTEKEAKNKAYLDTIRNSLAHGNVKIEYIVDNNKLIPLFILTDSWENKKTGQKINISLVSPSQNLNAFLQLADYDGFDIFGYDVPFSEMFNKPREK